MKLTICFIFLLCLFSQNAWSATDKENGIFHLSADSLDKYQKIILTGEWKYVFPAYPVLCHDKQSRFFLPFVQKPQIVYDPEY